MFQLLLRVFAPLLSLVVFTLGTGLLTTLLTVRLQEAGGGAWIVGLLTAVYYLGLVFGSFLIGRVIRRVGHIRVYAASAAILTTAVILQGMFVSDGVWLILRFISGYCVAGLYVSVESWLLVISPEERRGQVLSMYMVSFYAALAGGQFLLNLNDPTTIYPFCIITILCSMSIVPIAMTRAACPTFEDIAALSMRKLYKISPSGVLGCFAGGLITSVVYGLMPLFVKDLNFSNKVVALVMGVTIAGAMLLQYPVGRLSDFIERRKVLIGASFATLFICVIIMFTATHSQNTFLIASFLLGGAAFTLYPLSISLTCDYLDSTNIVAATQGLLLANGMGSIIGPVLVPYFIHQIGPLGLFVYFGIIAGCLGVFFSWRRSKKSSMPVKEQQDFVAVTRNTPVATEMDPRADE